MRKSKADVIAEAKKLAQNSPFVNMTEAEINALDYRDRDAKFKPEALSVLSFDTPYTDAFVQAYTDAINNLLSNKLRDLRSRRNAWQSALCSAKLDEMEGKLRDYVKAMNLRGARLSGYGSGISVEIERSFAAGGTVYLKWDRTERVVTNPDDATQRAYYYAPHVELSWSSTGRSLSVAMTAVAIYQELITIAAELETVFGRESVVSVWGMPEPIAEAPAAPAETSEVATT